MRNGLEDRTEQREFGFMGGTEKKSNFGKYVFAGVLGFAGLMSYAVYSSRPSVDDDYVDRIAELADPVFEEEVVVEEPELVIEPEPPKPKIEVKPEPPPVFSRDEIFPTEFDLSFFRSNSFKEKLRKVREYPKSVFEVLTETEKSSYGTYFSSNAIGIDNPIMLDELFPDFDWEGVFRRKMEAHGRIDIDNLTESDKLFIFMHETLKGFPYQTTPKREEMYEICLLRGDLFVQMNGKGEGGERISFPIRIGNIEYYVPQGGPGNFAYKIDEDLSDQEAYLEVRKYALNDWLKWRGDVKYLTRLEKEQLFDSKSSPLYETSHKVVREFVDHPSYKNEFLRVVGNRSYDNVFSKLYGTIIEEVIIGPAVAGAGAAGEAARNPMRARRQLRGDRR